MLIFTLFFVAACSLGIAALTQACAWGKIKLNPMVGIRTANTMVSEDTWQSGHAAAAISLAGLLFVGAPGTQLIMALVACALLVVAVVYGAKLANIAAVEALSVEKPRH